VTDTPLRQFLIGSCGRNWRMGQEIPNEFYQEMFRLKGWEWKGMSVNRPSVVGKYTNDLVYKRLAPIFWTNSKEESER
jgi:hypothetical protein